MLSIADLLKNYLFGRSGDRIEEAQNRWGRMVGALESAGGEKLAINYLRHLWVSLHGPIRERELYGEIKKKIKNKKAAIEFSSVLAEQAKYYAAIVNPQDQLWKQYGGIARDHVTALGYLRMEQLRPLLLAALSKFAPGEVRKLLRYLVSASVRFLVVGGLGGGTMERVYATTAAEISSGKATTAAAAVKLLKGSVPTDEQFETAFQTVRVPQAYLARYYLRALERAAAGEEEPEFVPNANEEEVNLEHVLPQNPSAAWAVPSDEASALYQRLGNLALMKTKPNREAGNKGFAAKQPFYKKSKLKYTKELATKNAWAEKEITARQKRLAKIAVKTWPLKLKA